MKPVEKNLTLQLLSLSSVLHSFFCISFSLSLLHFSFGFVREEEEKKLNNKRRREGNNNKHFKCLLNKVEHISSVPRFGSPFHSWFLCMCWLWDVERGEKEEPNWEKKWKERNREERDMIHDPIAFWIISSSLHLYFLFTPFFPSLPSFLFSGFFHPLLHPFMGDERMRDRQEKEKRMMMMCVKQMESRVQIENQKIFLSTFQNLSLLLLD